MTTFGERFKQLRKEKKLTQEQLAEKFFLNKSSISRYEQDKQIPEIDLLQKFADFFDVSLDYLLGRADIRKPESKQIYDAEELIDLLPEEYRDLFREQNIQYIKFAKEMMKSEIDPEVLLELIGITQKIKKKYPNEKEIVVKNEKIKDANKKDED